MQTDHAGALRIAVVTPYWREPDETLAKCIASVCQQTYPATHFLIADGIPKPLPEREGLIHVTLPVNMGNSGATPRGVGAQLAFNMGFDAVAFLDADNWYEPDHIGQAVRAIEQYKPDVVFARRKIVFPDGEVLQQEAPGDAKARHVDTNCFVFTRRAAFLVAAWLMWPRVFGTGEDRVMRWAIAQYQLKSVLLDKPTVWYVTNWRAHYKLANKQPVAPLRQPARKAAWNFHPETFRQRTGMRLALPEGRSASPPPTGLPVAPELAVVVWSPIQPLEVRIHQGAGNKPSDVLRLRLPAHDALEQSALGLGAVLAFQSGADIVLLQSGDAPVGEARMDDLVKNLKSARPGMVVDCTRDAAVDAESGLFLDRPCMLSATASHLAILLCQLPLGVSREALMPVLSALVLGKGESIDFLGAANKNVELAGPIQNLFDPREVFNRTGGRLEPIMTKKSRSPTENSPPRFSILIANYNYAGFVGQAISSVLEQDYAPECFELIVVDDGSTDDSLDIIRKFAGDGRVRVIAQSNQGQAAAFMAGLSLARYEWVCFLDSDDYYKPDKLSRLSRFIENENEVSSFICHDVEAFDEARQTSRSWFSRQKIHAGHLTIDQAAGGGYPFANPCGQVFRRELLVSLATTLKCEDWKRGADNPLCWGGLFLAGGVSYLHERLAVYRIHADNHFMAATPTGLAPKVDWLVRWPGLLEFLAALDQRLQGQYIGPGDRSALLLRMRQFFAYWTQRLADSASKLGLVSFITTCKNRLHHLRQALPAMVRQSHAEVIVVDYGCAQGTAAWVRANFPTVKIVEVRDDPGFCAARARNIGAAQAQGEVLCFIDADMILQGDLGAWITRRASEGRYYLAAPMPSYTVRGTVVCQRSAHHLAGGYDEAYQGWFAEDGDFYAALRELGQQEDGFPAKFLMPIEHGDEERALGGAGQMDSRAQAMRVALLYQTIKQDIARLTGSRLELNVRKQLLKTLMEQTKKYEASGHSADRQFIISINQGLEAYQAANLDRKLSYSFRSPRHIFRPQAAVLASRERGAGPPVSVQHHVDKLRVAMFHIGRSGSSVLADMLAQHVELRWDGEIYEKQIKVIEKKLGRFQFGSPECGFNPFVVLSKRLLAFAAVNYGFEVKFNHLEHCGCDVGRYLAEIKKLGINKYIILRRKNIFRKIVSSLIAEQTGAWHVAAGHTAPKGRISINPHAMQVERKSGNLLDLLDGYTRGFDLLDEAIEASGALQITFEDDIEQDPRIGFNKVIDYLGLPAMEPAVRLAKTNPYPLHELVENLDEIHTYLKGTPYSWMLEKAPPE